MDSRTASVIYLDHAATSFIAPEVREHFVKLLDEGIGNSSSAHAAGSKALALLNNAREAVSAVLGCEPGEITFTSGGTESNNWILQRAVDDARRTSKFRDVKPHVITSSIEHSSVANVAAWMKKQGLIEWDEFQVEPDGTVDTKKLEASFKSNTLLVSIGHGNNEIGTLQDLKAIGDVCHKQGVLFHADACQTFCHEPFSVRGLPVDFMALSGHKIRAPKGVGAVFIRNGVQVSPFMLGGKQEKGLRPGTTSVELISAFAKASSLWSSRDFENVHALRQHAIRTVKEVVPGARFNGKAEKSLCHVLSFTSPEVHSKILHAELARLGVMCSTGAACGTGLSDSSAVLLGLGRKPEEAHQIRISFSPATDDRMIDEFGRRLATALRNLKKEAK